MKKLTELIKEKLQEALRKDIITDNNFYYGPDFPDNNEIDKLLETHMHISAAYSGTDYADHYTLFEGLGVFEGAQEIVNYLMDNVFNKKEGGRRIKGDREDVMLSVHDFPTVTTKFCDNLGFIIVTQKNDPPTTRGSYVFAKNFYDKLFGEEFGDRWDSERQCLKNSVIYIYDVNNIPDDKLCEILLHELEHVWDDYILHKFMESSLENNGLCSSPVLEKLKTFLNCSLKFLDEYKLTTNIRTRNYDNLSKSEIRDIVMTYVYKLDKFETKAYISQLSGFLKHHNYRDVRNCFQYIVKYYEPYQYYRDMYILLNEKNDHSILKYIGASNKDIKKLQKISKNVWKKIMNHSWLACEKYIKYDTFKEGFNGGYRECPKNIHEILKLPLIKRKPIYGWTS